MIAKSQFKISLGLALLILTFTSVAQGQQPNQQQSSNSLTDAELLGQLASPDRQTADAAAALILERGERMLAPLMKLHGDKRLYAGFLHRTRTDSWFGGTGDPKNDKELVKRGYVITVEVAALYLISAIHYGTFSFASLPYLTDLTAEYRDQQNTPKLIGKAWKATEKWYRRLTESGLEKLRAADDYPLKNSQVEFW